MITSVSVVDWNREPRAHQLLAQREALVRLPLWASARPPNAKSAKSGWTLRSMPGAGGGVADMADRGMARQLVDHRAAAENVADQADGAMAVEVRAVEGDDAGGLLAAVLQRMQAERRVRRPHRRRP